MEKLTHQPSPFTNSVVLFLLLGAFILQGCAAAIIGVGAGAGALAYYNGKLTKTYKSEYHQTVRAAKNTLQELNIPITETTADELKTDIRALRKDGTPVTVEIIRLDRRHNEIAIRTGVVGVWDRQVSEQIHSYIDSRLGGTVVAYQKTGEEQGAQSATSTTKIKKTKEKKRITSSEKNASPDPPPADTQADSENVEKSVEEKRLKAAQIVVDSDFHIFFDVDSNALTPKSMQKLDRIYDIMSNDADTRLILNGYADSRGDPSYNQMVSELRANAVKNYLVGKSVDPARMTAVGHGSNTDRANN